MANDLSGIHRRKNSKFVLKYLSKIGEVRNSNFVGDLGHWAPVLLDKLGSAL